MAVTHKQAMGHRLHRLPEKAVSIVEYCYPLAAANLRAQKLQVLLLLYSIAMSAMGCHELPKLCNRPLCNAQSSFGYKRALETIVPTQRLDLFALGVPGVHT